MFSTLIGTIAMSGDVEVEYLTTEKDSVDRSEYTFSSVGLGAASNNREIYVAVGTRDAGSDTTIDSVTVGGVAATSKVAATNTSGGNITRVEIWSANVPTGSTGDIVVTLSETTLITWISVYRAVNVGSTIPYSSATDTGTTITLDANTPSGKAFIIGAAQCNDTGTTSWTGIATEDYDSDDGTSILWSSAHENIDGSAETPRTMSSVNTGNYGAGCCIVIQQG